MSKSGLKDESNFAGAASCAERMRMAPAGSYPGGMPPSGPKPEPVRVNNVPMVGSKSGGLNSGRSK
ncbi:MAG TPA: hypothetical protein VMT67_13905 [Terriglobales bacterium]|nr:hypothetical protein [Terriglobales bacterium]